MLNQDSRIYIAGHTGMIGTVLTKRLQELGYRNLLYKTHKELDLTRQDEVEAFFKINRPEYVIMNAAVQSNSVNVHKDPIGIMLGNALMIQNIFSAAMQYGVKKMLYVGSAACYPSDAEKTIFPNGSEMVLEDAMRPGRIDKLTERYYVMPKLLATELCRVLNETGTMQCVVALPTHIYGYYYYYHEPQRLAVYPALVKRFCDAVRQGFDKVTIWGSGNLRREFTHVNDLVEAFILLLIHDDAIGNYNIGAGKMISIRELACALKEITRFKGEVVFDTTKPDADEIPMLGTEKIRTLGWKPKVEFADGVRMSCEYYIHEYEK